MSCESEFSRLTTSLSRVSAPWAIAPGNHDGFFMGVSLPTGWKRQAVVGQQGWDARCRRAGYRANADPGQSATLAFSKAHFIRRYLELLANDSPFVPEDWVGNSGVTEDLRKCIASALNAREPGSFFHCRASTSSLEKPWLLEVAWSGALKPAAVGGPRGDEAFASASKSFLLQVVSLASHVDDGAVKLILLDTSQYESAPVSGFNLLSNAFRNPGSKGSVLDDQWGLVRDVLKNRSKDDVFLLAGHHDFGSWTSQSKRAFHQVLTDFRPSRRPLYFSAHTHSAFIADYSDPSFTEINVGSLIDWPLSYRTLDILSDQGRLTINSPYFEFQAESPDRRAAGLLPPSAISVVRFGDSIDSPRSRGVLLKVQCDAGGFALSNRAGLQHMRSRPLGFGGLSRNGALRAGEGLIKDQLKVLKFFLSQLTTEDDMIHIPRWRNAAGDHARKGDCGEIGWPLEGGGKWHCESGEQVRACLSDLISSPTVDGNSKCYSNEIVRTAMAGTSNNNYYNMAEFVDQLRTTSMAVSARGEKFRNHMICNVLWGSLTDYASKRSSKVLGVHASEAQHKMLRERTIFPIDSITEGDQQNAAAE